MKPERNDDHLFSHDTLLGTAIIIGSLLVGIAGGFLIATNSGNVEAGASVCVAGLVAFIVSGTLVGIRISGKIK